MAGRNALKNILVLNCGSSSMKLSLFHGENRLLDANLEGMKSASQKLTIHSDKGIETHVASSHVGLPWIFETLNCDPASIGAIGHRFVHGGDRYSASTLIDTETMRELEKLTELAPLHNAACLLGIQQCLEWGPQIPEIAVFDTAFHRSIPPCASHYAIPKELSEKYAIKRYGFHGIAHAFSWETYKAHGGKSKLITIHLGNGCSMAAIQEGISLDTSMGFTPAEGLIMATRAGDIDSAIVEYLCAHEKKSPSDIMDILNFKSGLFGISGSSRMEEILPRKDENACLAVEMFCYRLLKYLGAYMTVLEGADALIFSGGIGENSPVIRSRILQKLEWMGLKIDVQANEIAVGLSRGAIQKISHSKSSLDVYVVASDENLFIAKEVLRFML